MAGDGLSVEPRLPSARGLGVRLPCGAGAPTPAMSCSLRHAYLTEIIRQVHEDSLCTYGARRVHASCARRLLPLRAPYATTSGRTASKICSGWL